jgi:uncharacterized cupredoxin-like copper-binding protein
MQFRKRTLSTTRTPLTIVRLSLLLALSACSLGAYSAGEGQHGHGDSEEAHHDGPMDDHHADDNNGKGEGEDHHESMAGRPGIAENVTRTVAVDMDDSMAYTPSKLTVKAGETIRFTVKNSGQLVHEFVLGASEEILEHHGLMKRFPGMEHDEPNSVSLKAEESGDVVWQFSKAGTFEFACLQPGHYEAGMEGDVVVGTYQ